MYEIVTPILYREPVVQDLGLFLRGIERPLPAGTSVAHPNSIDHVEPLPLHKLHALALVKGMHLVHASSRHPITPVATRKEREKTRLDSNRGHGRYAFVGVYSLCHTDSLAENDINGWNKADTIVTKAEQVHGESFSILQGIDILTLGQWDDGRWKSYAWPSPDRNGPHNGTGRDKYLDDRIKKILKSTGTLHQTLRAKHTCGRQPHGPYSNTPLYADQTGIVNIHASNIEDIRLPRPYPAHVRVYVNIAIYKPYQGVLDINMNMVQSAMDPYSSYDRLLYRVPVRTRERTSGNMFDAIDTVVELCIVTEEGNKEQNALALKVKRAYERYISHTAQSKGPPCGGELRILIGDQVPVCPCCGVA